MRLDKAFYEGTRISLMDGAICVSDHLGNIIYMNKSFSALCRRHKPEGIVSYGSEGGMFRLMLSGGSRQKIMFGRREKIFESAVSKVFDERTVLYVDSDIATDIFPTVNGGYVYIAADTFSGKIYIPLFGGEVYKTVSAVAPRRGIDREARDAFGLVGSVSDIGTKYVCLKHMLITELSMVMDRAYGLGYRVAIDPAMLSNAVCNVSVYDLSLVFGLMIVCVMKNSDSKMIRFMMGDSSDRCGIIIETENKNAGCGKGMCAEDFFAADSEEHKVLSSLSKLCRLYSWKLVCREKPGKFALMLSIPVCNAGVERFREKTDDVYTGSL